MTASSLFPSRPRPAAAAGPRRPRAALLLVLCAQLMIILDATVVNIALPGIQQGLHFSATGLSWVLNAYALAFGGLLLLGGRAGDILGRRRTFIAGIALFTVASLGCGAATTAGWLIAARAVQGAGAAMAAPAALSLIVSAFPEGGGRTRALSMYAAVAMGGASLGLVTGGLITAWASWRWVFFINLPAGAAVSLLAPVFLAETPRRPGQFDIAGALTSVTGMSALVYAFIRAATAGWSDAGTVAALGAAAAGLAAFLVAERRARQPVTPLRLFADTQRSASYVARLLLVAGMFGMFFFVSQFLQEVPGFSPIQAGLAFLPMTLLVFAVSRVASRLLGRFPPVPLMIAGTLPVIAAMTWLAGLSPATRYVPGILGPMLLLGIGMGLAFVPLTTISLAGVRPDDAGAASGMVNVTQQLGGALGLAILVTVFGGAVRHGSGPIGGMAEAFRMATALDLGSLAAMTAAGAAAWRRGRRAAGALARGRTEGTREMVSR